MNTKTMVRRIVTALSAALLTAAGASCIAPESAHCDQMTSCGACTAAGSGCGWCDGACMDGTSLGPSAGTCSSWSFDRCSTPDEPPPSTQVDSGASSPPPVPVEEDSGAPFYQEPDASGVPVDCASAPDCFTCASTAGCAYCGDYGTCSDITDAFNSCSTQPITSTVSCD